MYSDLVTSWVCAPLCGQSMDDGIEFCAFDDVKEPTPNGASPPFFAISRSHELREPRRNAGKNCDDEGTPANDPDARPRCLVEF